MPRKAVSRLRGEGGDGMTPPTRTSPRKRTTLSPSPMILSPLPTRRRLNGSPSTRGGPDAWAMFGSDVTSEEDEDWSEEPEHQLEDEPEEEEGDLMSSVTWDAESVESIEWEDVSHHVKILPSHTGNPLILAHLGGQYKPPSPLPPPQLPPELELVTELDIPVAQRTRTHLSMQSLETEQLVSLLDGELRELEAQLRPTGGPLSPFTEDADRNEYLRFINSLRMTTPECSQDEEDNDEDFVPRTEREPMDEFRREMITTDEITELMKEFIDDADEGEDQTASLAVYPVTRPPFTGDLLAQLQEQIRKHMQLLIQIIVLTTHTGNTSSGGGPGDGRKMNVDTLPLLHRLIDDLLLKSGTISLFSNAITPFLQETSSVMVTGYYNHLSQLLEPSTAAFDAKIVPTSSAWKPPPRREQFTPSEDALLLRGIQHHGYFHWDKIREHFLPTKTVESIHIHFKNMTARKARNNPLKEFYLKPAKPLTEDEETLLVKGLWTYGKQWHTIARELLPQKTRGQLRQHFQQHEERLCAMCQALQNQHQQQQQQQQPSVPSPTTLSPSIPQSQRILTTSPGGTTPTRKVAPTMPRAIMSQTPPRTPSTPRTTPSRTPVAITSKSYSHSQRPSAVCLLSFSSPTSSSPSRVVPVCTTSPVAPGPVHVPAPSPPTSVSPSPVSSTAMPAADNLMTHGNGQVIRWSRSEDRAILLATRQDGATAKTWASLTSPTGALSNRTPLLVSERYQCLMNLMTTRLA